MGKLEEKIKNLEDAMETDTLIIEHDQLKLRDYMCAHPSIPFLILFTGFTGGYLLTRKKSLFQILKTLGIIAFTVKNVNHNINRYLT